jgi:hypothetical protein
MLQLFRIEWYERMMMHSELEKMQQAVVEAYFKVLSRH